VNLGTDVNSPATDGGPSFFENDAAGIPQLYMTSSKAGGLGGIDIYVSALVGGVFQPPTPVSELNTAQFDLSPSIRHDGLEIAFTSDRPGRRRGPRSVERYAIVRERDVVHTGQSGGGSQLRVGGKHPVAVG
jgi:Tol biopolymer transport system component